MIAKQQNASGGRDVRHKNSEKRRLKTATRTVGATSYTNKANRWASIVWMGCSVAAGTPCGVPTNRGCCAKRTQFAAGQFGGQVLCRQGVAIRAMREPPRRNEANTAVVSSRLKNGCPNKANLGRRFKFEVCRGQAPVPAHPAGGHGGPPLRASHLRLLRSSRAKRTQFRRRPGQGRGGADWDNRAKRTQSGPM